MQCSLVPAGYRCPIANCQVHEYTWRKLQKHKAKHPGENDSQFKTAETLPKCLRNNFLLVGKNSWLIILPFSNGVVATFTCQVCKKMFKKVDALRRHKRIHASHKPVLVCPREDCQAYFSTTFNLQHHIRKVHLDLLKYKCSYPDCPRMFAMRVSI